jgi:uncharacterized protein YndB with AHSA1/START domain
MLSKRMFLGRIGCKALGLALVIWPTVAVADIASSPPGMTEFAFQLHVKSNAADAYAAVTHPQTWWSGEHSYSGNAANMSLDAVAGGCWCEKLPSGGSVAHMHVAAALPGSLLRLTGALGPLQGQPVTGIMTWVFKDEPKGGATVDLKYRLAGPTDLPAGWPQSVDHVLGEQVQRLQRLLDGGAP